MINFILEISKPQSKYLVHTTIYDYQLPFPPETTWILNCHQNISFIIMFLGHLIWDTLWFSYFLEARYFRTLALRYVCPCPIIAGWYLFIVCEPELRELSRDFVRFLDMGWGAKLIVIVLGQWLGMLVVSLGSNVLSSPGLG